MFRAVALLALPLIAFTQSPSYLASIKPNNAVDPRGFSEYSAGGRLTATAVTVASLMRVAYRIQPYQLEGAPGWIATKRFDIVAKADGSPAPSQQEFVQALLKDRFGLVIHNETREMPVFALVAVKPKMTQSTFDCDAYRAGPHALPAPGRTPDCATSIGPRTLSGRAISTAQLAAGLGPITGRFTVDKTGLAGVFDVELKWAPDDDTAGPSIFSALQEQLGLKLVAEKGPVPVVVVDRVTEPSENQ
jgi:uncharacterized protein (TIGR03435 family)